MQDSRPQGIAQEDGVVQPVPEVTALAWPTPTLGIYGSCPIQTEPQIHKVLKRLPTNSLLFKQQDTVSVT
jgi:hypothetical protein